METNQRASLNSSKKLVERICKLIRLNYPFILIRCVSNDDEKIEIGVLAGVPNGVGRTSDQQEHLKEIHNRGYPAPVAIRTRESLFQGCWKQQCTPRYYVDHHRDRKRNHEMDTLEKLEQLAAEITEVGKR